MSRPYPMLLTCALLLFPILVQAQNRVLTRQGNRGPDYEKLIMPKDTVEVPVTIASTQLLVEDVFVNGEGPFRFMLDTGGMGGGRIDTSLMKKLGLTPEGEVQAGDTTNRGARAMSTTTLQSIEFNGLKFEGVRVLSRDYNRHAAGIRGHIDGILGFGLFQELLLTIDYSGRKLTVQRGALPPPDGATILEMNGSGVPEISLSIDGEVHTAHLDTGAMGWISISEQHAKKLEFTSEPLVIGEARTLTGSFPIKRAKLNGTVRLGQHTLQQPVMVMGSPLRGVNVGGMILRDFVVTYDQSNGRVRILPATNVRDENAPEFSRLGLQPIEVPMKVKNGRPMIEAHINGQGPFRFLLDTGAGSFVLKPSVAKELKLSKTGTTAIGDPTNPTQFEVDTLMMDLVEIGTARFEQVPAIRWNALGIPDIDGIIGLPLFQDCVMSMDYQREKLTMRRAPLGKDDGSIPFRWDKGFAATIDLEIGDVRIATHIDSGNMGYINLPLEFADQLTLQEPPRVIGRARAASGTFDIYGAQLQGVLNLGGHLLNDPKLQFNNKFAWGNVGSRSLAGLTLSIDQTNMRIKFSAN